MHVEETKRSRKLTEDSFAVSKKSFYSFRVMNRQCKKNFNGTLPFINDFNSCGLRADLARSFDQFLLAFLEGYRFADFFLHVGAMLSGNGDADVASYSCTFLGREWDARLLLLDAAVLLGVVRALLTVNAVFAGHILTLGQRLLMADFLGYLVADGFRDIDTNGSDDRLNGSDDRSNRRDGRKEETFGLLGFLQVKRNK